MVKSVLGIAAATMLAAAVMPTAPANAAPIQNAPGIAEHQSGVETVQYRRYNRRYVRAPVRRLLRTRPLRLWRWPVLLRRRPVCLRAPYPYYRGGYYAPRPFIGIGPFGFGVW